MAELVAILIGTIVAVFVLVKILPFQSVVIQEYQRGLKYFRGRYKGLVDPGKYWVWKGWSSIVPVDVRIQHVTIPGQDVMTADGVTLKISMAAEYQLQDPNIAVNRTAQYQVALYLGLQTTLRQVVGEDTIDVLMEKRLAIGPRLLELSRPKATAIGVQLLSVNLKDVMFSGDLKRAFSQVVRAQKEGQAALERARGETAALRNLANAAKMIEDNPNLLQLRALQSLGESSGNTLVMGVPAGVSVQVKNGKPAKTQSDVED